MFKNLTWGLPPAVTQIAEKFDSLYIFIVSISALFCVLLVFAFILFSVLYRRKTKNQKSAYIPHHLLLEFLWGFIPFLIFMFVFFWGWKLFYEMNHAPRSAIEIQVYGQKWFWSFQYKSGKKTAKELYVPVGKPVKLIMTSKDVIHSFFIPAFRIKQDVLPGRYTSLWFESKQTGSFYVFCAEYCGDQHANMLAKINVLSEKDYDKWLKTNPYKGLSMTQIGQKVYTSRCIACHTSSETSGIGPGFKNLFGKKRNFLKASSVIADENYIRESILNPNKKIVQGFDAALMPSFIGQLTEEEISGLIEYIKSLK